MMEEIWEEREREKAENHKRDKKEKVKGKNEKVRKKGWKKEGE